MSDILLVLSGMMAFIVFCGLEGGAFTCSQALLGLIPAAALLLASFCRSSVYEPAEKGGYPYAEHKRLIR